MKGAHRNTLAAATALLTLIAASALAGGGYGMSPYATGYGPAMGYGPQAGYGVPPMGMPAHPQRPQPPERPTPPPRPMMGGAYGYDMPKPMMPAYPRAPQGYGLPQRPAAPAAAPAPETRNSKAVDEADVSIAQMRFSAPTVTLKVGGSVTWTNSEGMPHTVTASDGSFGSAQLGAGDTFVQRFDEPGTYSHYCTLHPSMRATVVVVA